MDDATRVSIEGPLFGLDDRRDTCFPEETPSPSRDPPTETPAPREPHRRVRSLGVPASAARALELFRPVVERTVHRWGVPMRDAPDVAQKLLIRLLRKWAGEQGCLPDKPREYVVVAARRAALEFLRCQRELAEVPTPPGAMSKLLARALGDDSGARTPEDVLVSEDTLAEVAREVDLDMLKAATTPERWRTFHAYAVELLPAKVIAVMEQAPIGTIYNRIRLARRDLRCSILRRRAANRGR